MEPLTLLLVVAATIAAATPAAANLAPAGPYNISVEYFGKCDDGEYPDQIINMSMKWDEEKKQTYYSGYFNRTYDDLADDCQMDISVYRWGSTGGWTKFYALSFTKPFDYVKENFPEVYKYVWNPMGIKKKPVPAGVYYLNRYMTDTITMKKFDALPYGKYKVYTRGSKGGKRPSCLQMTVNILEVGVDKALASKSPLLGSLMG